MLERIETIQGIGLLHQAMGKPHKCEKATLIYADNGRGKSTLATIFRSTSTGNASLVGAYKTLDGTLPPKVVLQFDSGHKVSFENGSWSEQRSELLVFDADFIGRNVHSGGSVSTDHRKNLLQFALGEAAVSARLAVEKATGDSKSAAEKVQNLTGQLSGHHQDLSLSQFEQLPVVSDVDTQFAELQTRLTAASNVATILAKPVPRMVPEPSFDTEALFAGLSLSLKDVHADAGSRVKEHIVKLGGGDAESWLSRGQQLRHGSTCPFCDQDISLNDLVLAYQTHFNVAYTKLKQSVGALRDKVTTGTGGDIIDACSKSVEVAAAQAASWAEHVPTDPIVFDTSSAHAALTALRTLLVELTSRKQVTPAEQVGSEADKAQAISLWEQLLASVRRSNAAISAAEARINTYRAKLTGDNVAQLKQRILVLQATKRRHDPSIAALLVQLGTARSDAATAEKAKKAARENLDRVMTTALTKYQTSINQLLNKFGATFSITDMSANFRGAAPRTEYGLLLRGKGVVLEGGPPSFATTLSEGDKRALAFAFFIASTLQDPKLATRTVVVDDPMCSLDANRKTHTRAVLRDLSSRCAQLLVLAHDPYFLRDLRDALKKDDKTTTVGLFQLTAAQDGYTDFAAIDIDQECESPYSRHHRLLKDFSGGKGGDPRNVAKAIRPLLEGYLHRRFPGLLPTGFLFGQIVALIRDSTAPNPLCHAADLVDTLNELNEYAGQFHHDTNPDTAESIVVTAPELKTYVDRALSVVYKSAP